MSAPAAVEDKTIGNPDVLTKYKAAGEIAQRVLSEVRELLVPGAVVGEVTAKGDARLTEETTKVFNNRKGLSKGIAFPTSVSIDSCVAHNSPVTPNPEDKLVEGQVAKVMVGAQIDGYASIVADTFVVGGSKPTEDVANVIAAAWTASEAALRSVKIGGKNFDVTRVVQEVTSEFKVNALEGMLSQQHEQNNVAGKKKIILNPSEQQRRDFETVTFAENEVYGLDILVTGGSGKVKPATEVQTSIYRKTELTYQLKLRTSRLAITEIQKKCGSFPFNVNVLEDQKRVRMALQEPLNHGLLEAYDVSYDKDGKPVVQFFTTFALTKNGIIKLAAPAQPDLAALGAPKTTVDSEDLAKVLATSLKLNKKKKPAKKAAEN